MIQTRRWIFLALSFFFSISVFAQNHLEMLTVDLGNVTVNYHFMDDASRKKLSEFNNVLSRGFDLYTRMFGNLPRDIDGNEYSEISVHLKKGRHMGGEADPQFISITWNEGTVFGVGRWQTLLLHELFHLWNAESFRYKNGKEQWFNEGVTEYYAFRAAVQLDFISPREMLNVAATPIGFYTSAVRDGQISMREAGLTNKSKFDNYFLVYYGGWVVAMILDYDIRRLTKGRKSLDHVLRWLYVNYHRDKLLYDYKDILEGLSLVSGKDYAPFFNEFIASPERIPISEYFPLADIVWSYEFQKYEKDKHLFDSLNGELLSK